MILFAATLLRAQTSDIGHEIAADLRAGKSEQARVLAEKALASSPRDARLWTLKGLALVQLTNQPEALTCFNRALALAPDYLPALQGAAQIQYETDPPQATPFLQRILKLRSNDATSHAMLADISIKSGDCDTARRESALSQPDASEAVALKAFGWCLVKQKRLPEAISAFERLNAFEPGERSLYSLAVAQFLAGRFSAVISTLGPAAEQHTVTPDMLELLAESYDFTSDSARAVSTLKRAISAQPNAPEYYADYAYMCQAHGWFQQGIEMLDAGLQRLPKEASLYVARGVLYSELSKWAEGESDFQTASQLNPNVELGSAAQGLAELQRSDLTKAEKTVREKLRQHPNDAFLYYLLAEVLAKKGATPGSSEFDEALRSAARAVELKPDLLLAHNVLARLYLANGENAKAAEQSRIVNRANPKDETALYHLIVALRKTGPSPELPQLLKELAQLKEHNRKQDGLERKTDSLAPAAERK